MQLTLFTDYGLRTLMYLASRPDQLCSVKEIADYYHISRHHLVKIVHHLAQQHYVESNKGKGGGIRLAKDVLNLRLGDLTKALEPHMNLVECFDKTTNTCRITASCHLKHYLFEANAAFIESLNQHTLADVVAKKIN